MITPQEYLEGILAEIETAKTYNYKGVYRVNDKISDEIALYVKAYFEHGNMYRTEIRKCLSCLNTWDVLIFF